VRLVSVTIAPLFHAMKRKGPMPVMCAANWRGQPAGRSGRLGEGRVRIWLPENRACQDVHLAGSRHKRGTVLPKRVHRRRRGCRCADKSDQDRRTCHRPASNAAHLREPGWLSQKSVASHLPCLTHGLRPWWHYCQRDGGCGVAIVTSGAQQSFALASVSALPGALLQRRQWAYALRCRWVIPDLSQHIWTPHWDH
jgi:hypothetical protein